MCYCASHIHGCVFYLSFGDEVGHDGSVAELGGQMDATAALAIDQRRVCAIFHELHHHR